MRLRNMLIRDTKASNSWKQVLLCLLLTLFVYGCDQKKLYPLEYAAWVEDESNGLVAKKQVGEYEFSLLYKPLEYIALTSEKNPEIKRDTLVKRMQLLGELQYFTFRMSKSGKDVLSAGKSAGIDYQLLEHFTSHMQNDILLIDGTDTLSCLLFHYERNYGLSPFSNIVLGFEKPGQNKENNFINDKTFIYDDKILGTGPVRFVIEGASINDIPQLITY